MVSMHVKSLDYEKTKQVEFSSYLQPSHCNFGFLFIYFSAIWAFLLSAETQECEKAAKVSLMLH